MRHNPEVKRYMPILEAIATFMISLGANFAIAAYYSKLADQYLKDKNEKVDSVQDESFFSFVDSIQSIRKSKILKGKKKEAPLSTEEYQELMSLSRNLMDKTSEYNQWEGFLEDIACRLRNGAKYWVYSGVLSGMGSGLYVMFSAFSIPLFYNEIPTMYILEAIIAICVSVLIAINLRIFQLAQNDLNRLDFKSKNLTPMRTWSKRT
jgi:hypothetical protein